MRSYLFPILFLAATLAFLGCDDDDTNNNTSDTAMADTMGGDTMGGDTMGTDTMGTDGMDDTGGTNTIVDIAAGDDQFSTLVGALTTTGLDATLAGDGPFTVFAPTDDAFAALGVDLSTLSNDELSEILLYHVVPGSVDSGSIPATADTAAELTLVFDTSDGVKVNNATVTTADIMADNGIIHIIDTVLLPPDIVDMAGHAGLTSLAGAIGDAGLESALRGDGPLTVFAPVESAFEDPVIAAILPTLSTEELAAVLQYHVIAGETDSANLPAWADTLIDLSVIFNTTDGAKINQANIIVTDIKVTNGIIHLIDAVIIPSDVVELATYAGFSALGGALDTAGLIETLEGDGPFTVFAPTDDAFAAIETVVSSLTVEQLTSVLLYHVVSGAAVDAASVPARADSASPNAWNNNMTLLFDTTDGVKVNGVAVVTADIKGTNGIIHVIEEVLVPPTITDIVGIAGLTGLGDAVGAASNVGSTSVADVLAGSGPFTVFAPTNAAFTEIETTLATLSADQVRDVLLYHVVGGATPVLSTDLANGDVGTQLTGQSITINVDSGVVFTDEAGTDHGPVGGLLDIHTANGVVHVIDGVLIPTL